MICNCCKNVVARSADVCPSCGNDFTSWFGEGRSYPAPSAGEIKAAQEKRIRDAARKKAKAEARKARVEEIGEEAVVQEEFDAVKAGFTKRWARLHWSSKYFMLGVLLLSIYAVVID